MTDAGPVGMAGREGGAEAGGVLADKDFAGSVMPSGQLVRGDRRGCGKGAQSNAKSVR